MPQDTYPPTLRELVRELARSIQAAGRDAPGLTARRLAEAALGLPENAAIIAPERLVAPGEVAAARALVARRCAGEPLAHILGRKEFFGRDFLVDGRVLVPRPDTEVLVEAVLAAFPADRPLRFADCGTGSGILAVTLAAERPLARGVAVDLSPGALAVARANAAAHGVAGKVAFVRADFASLPVADASLHLIVANPPYLSEAEYAAADDEVRDHDPRLALVGGPRGDEPFAGLLAEAFRALLPGGRMYMEIGWEQGRAAMLAAAAAGLAEAAVFPDLAGRDRVLVARKPA